MPSELLPCVWPGGAEGLGAAAVTFTFTARPLTSATTDPPEEFVLGTVSVLVPRRWMLDIGIFSSRLTTCMLEERFFANTSVRAHSPTGAHVAHIWERSMNSSSHGKFFSENPVASLDPKSRVHLVALTFLGARASGRGGKARANTEGDASCLHNHEIYTWRPFLPSHSAKF